MKKLLALLLALFLLPASAMAEAMCFELTVRVNEENLAEQLKASGSFAGSDEAALCEGLAQMLNGAGLRVITQENGGSVELLLAGKTLLDAAVTTGETDLLLVSSLMSGYGLTLPLEIVELLAEALAEVQQGIDWESLLADAINAAAAQLAGVKVTSTRGSFSGHAYTGGVYCDTYTFDDAQVAAILSALMTDDLRSVVMEAAALMELDAASLLAQFDAKNAQVTADNPYRYILRVVYDARMELIGLSAVVLQGDSQLATLSFGIGKDTLQIVIGIGMDEANYWHSHSISIADYFENGVQHMTLSGTIQEFTAPNEDDFAYALAASGMDQLRAVWNLDVAYQGEETAWKLTHQERRGQSTDIAMLDWSGTYTPGQQLQSTLSTRKNGQDVLTVTLAWQPCEPIAPHTADLTLCSLLDTNDTLLTEIAYEAGMELAVRLLQTIPTQLLTYLQ